MTISSDPDRYVGNIGRRGWTIYQPVDIGDPELWLPSEVLQFLLDRELAGLSLKGLPLRTRSKVVKEHVCKALGYAVPPVFRRTRPRFPCQQFDIYVQKAGNLQIWNDEINPSRRYVIVLLSRDDIVKAVSVLTGSQVAHLDTTGTLTQKYQARFVPGPPAAQLVPPGDTANVKGLAQGDSTTDLRDCDPSGYPAPDTLLPAEILFDRLRRLLGLSFTDPGIVQERVRGTQLQAHVCQAIGYNTYKDHGQFPDIRHQLLEIKLQTSPTIDLGLVSPDSLIPLDLPQIDATQLRHCDVRYAVYFAQLEHGALRLTHLFVANGEVFFANFPRFGGLVVNRKLQIPLPGHWFLG